MVLGQRWAILSAARIARLHSEPDWPKTLDEFRAWHERQPDVWEFIDGIPKLMAPGSMAHTLIKSNTHAALTQAVQGTDCRALVDGGIVEVEGSSLIPDVLVTCRELDFTTPRIDDALIVVEPFRPRTRRTTSAASSRCISRCHRCAITSSSTRIGGWSCTISVGKSSASPFSRRSPRPTPCAWTRRASRSRSPRSTRAYRSPEQARGATRGISGCFGGARPDSAADDAGRLELDPQASNGTLGTTLEYQDDIAKVQRSEAARLLADVKRELAAAG